MLPIFASFVIFFQLLIAGAGPARSSRLALPSDGSASTPAAGSTPRQHAGSDNSAEIARFAAALRSPDLEERRSAVIGLAALGDPAAAGPLTSAVQDPSPLVRAQALEALGTLGRDSSASVIIAALKGDKDPFVRKTAAYALGAIGGAEAPASLALALGDKDQEVRGAAAVALSRCPDSATIAPLTRALKDKSDFVRARAAEALGANGRAAAAAVPELVHALTGDGYSEARRQAAAALGLIGNPSAIPALERAAHSPDPYLSQIAREAIEKLRQQAVSR